MSAEARLPAGAAATPRGVLNREGAILVFGLACVFVLMEFGRTPYFRQHVAQHFEHLPLPTLHPYLWTSAVSVVSRMLAPLVFIVFVLRESPRDFGYRPAGGRTFLQIYAVLLAVMIPVLWVAAGTTAFQHKYPFWEDARLGWRNLLIYEVRYFFVFLSGESFWRGFLVFGLARRFGWHALSISMVPYVMVHFGKPPAETLGAIVTAYVLGYLALKHRSFWLGVGLHYTVAFLMDFAALYRSGQFPTTW